MTRYDDGRLGIEEELAGVAVGAAPVGPESGGEQEPAIQQQQLLLAVDAKVPHRPVVLEHADARRLVGILLPREQRAGQDPGGVEIAVLVLHADRGGGLEAPRGRREGVVAVDREVQVQVGRLAQHHRARLPVVGLVLELGRRDEVVLLVEVVRPADGDEVEVVPLVGEQVHPRGQRAQRPPGVLVVLEEAEGLDRVAALERIEREVGDLGPRWARDRRSSE